MQDLLDSVRRFCAGEIAPRAAEVDRSGRLPEGLFAKLGTQGLAGLALPARWGGIDADLALFGGCLEIIGGACASTAWALLAHTLSTRAILTAGTEAQKERWLPALAAGRSIGCAMAGTEAGGGSNPLGIRTRARRDGDGWVLDGSKAFISLAGLADLYVVMARTAEPPAALGCFVVERGDADFGFGRREELLGVRGVPVGELAFSDCGLPGDRLLGAESAGLVVMGAIGAWGLVGAASAALGIAGARVHDPLGQQRGAARHDPQGLAGGVVPQRTLPTAQAAPQPARATAAARCAPRRRAGITKFPATPCGVRAGRSR